MENKRKFVIIKRGVKLDEPNAEEKKDALRTQTGIRAGGLGCGGPRDCVAVHMD
ncbi:MAG: hypothetical protein ACLQVI_09235 [Polyangiaceae bacterium]|jgi:hypothetical protein